MTYHVGDPSDIESERAYVVYDGRTGEIVHVHRTLVLRGADAEPEARDAEQAIELARRFGHRHDDLRTLPVSAEEAELRTPHRVDLDEPRLVPADPGEAA